MNQPQTEELGIFPAPSPNDILPCYRKWVYKTAGVFRDPSDPDFEDLVQEGFIEIWRALLTYDESKGSLPSWLTMKARSHMRKIAFGGQAWTGQPSRRDGRNAIERPEVVSLDEPVKRDGYMYGGEVTRGDLIPDTGGVDEESIGLQESVRAALGTLTDSQLRYVTARFWLGMTNRQMKEEGLFRYEPSAVWTGAAKGGAKRKLAAGLAHLSEAA